MKRSLESAGLSTVHVEGMNTPLAIARRNLARHLDRARPWLFATYESLTGRQEVPAFAIENQMDQLLDDLKGDKLAQRQRKVDHRSMMYVLGNVACSIISYMDEMVLDLPERLIVNRAKKYGVPRHTKVPKGKTKAQVYAENKQMSIDKGSWVVRAGHHTLWRDYLEKVWAQRGNGKSGGAHQKLDDLYDALLIAIETAMEIAKACAAGEGYALHHQGTVRVAAVDVGEVNFAIILIVYKGQILVADPDCPGQQVELPNIEILEWALWNLRDTPDETKAGKAYPYRANGEQIASLAELVLI